MISTGFHSDLPFDQYLSIERLSPSGAKLLNRSPAHYRHQRIHPAPETAAFRVGHAVHALALEGRSVFEAGFAVAPECDRRTTVGKQVWAEFVSWSAGKAVLTASEAELVEGMAGSILDHPLAPSLLSGGDAELSLCWDDPLTGAACKGRVDLARLLDGAIIDLKTTLDASPQAFARAVLNYGYATQAAAYLAGAASLGADVRDFIVLAVEKAPPFAVGVYRLPDAALELGRRRWGEACELYATCIESGHWPGYGDGIRELILPSWAVSELYDETNDSE